MVHIEKVVREFELSYEGVVDFKEFLHVLKEFFKRYDYDITEKVYAGSTKDGLKNTNIKWDCDRKVDDYNQCFIKLKLGLSDYKEGYVDSKKVIDGKLKIIIEAEIQKDYGANWKKSPLRRFVRAVYDKYVVVVKQDKVSKELSDIVENLKKEIKQYLNI